MDKIKRLFDESLANDDIFMICATVDTGFEWQAIDEHREKISATSEAVKERGRIYFNIKWDQYEKVREMRSIDNIFVVADVRNIAFDGTNKEADLELVKDVVQERMNLNKGLDIWKRMTCFMGELYPTLEEYNAVQEKMSGTNVKKPVPASRRKKQESDVEIKESEPVSEVKEPEAVIEVKEAKPVVEIKESEAVIKIKEAEPVIEIKEEPESGIKIKEEPEAVIEIKEPEPVSEVKEPEAVIEIKKAELVTKVEKQEPVIEIKAAEPITKLEKQEPVIEIKEAEPVVEIKEPELISEIKKPEAVIEIKEQESVITIKEQALVIEETEEMSVTEKENKQEFVTEVKDQTPVTGVKNAETNKGKGVRIRGIDPSKSEKGDIIRYRVTCERSGEHAFESIDAACVIGGELQTKYHWIVDLSKYHLEIICKLAEQQLVTLLRVTHESKHRRNIVSFGSTTLRSTICYNLLRLANPKLGDIVIDPMCGTGSIPIEAALGFSNLCILCGDNNSEAMDRMKSNINGSATESQVNPVQWMALQLPLKDSFVDVIVTDMPFGKRSGKRSNNDRLYKQFLVELGRVVKVRSGRLVLLTHDKRNFNQALRAAGDMFVLTRAVSVKIGGLQAIAYVLRRSAVHYTHFKPRY